VPEGSLKEYLSGKALQAPNVAEREDLH